MVFFIRSVWFELGQKVTLARVLYLISMAAAARPVLLSKTAAGNSQHAQQNDQYQANYVDTNTGRSSANFGRDDNVGSRRFAVVDEEQTLYADPAARQSSVRQDDEQDAKTDDEVDDTEGFHFAFSLLKVKYSIIQSTDDIR